MIILAITDIHGRYSVVYRLIKKVDLDKIDLLIIAGDISHFGDLEEVTSFLKTISQYFQKILFIPGNCDPPQLLNYNLGDKVINIHLKKVLVNKYTFYGIGGSNLTPFRTFIEFSEEELKHYLRNVEKNEECNRLIMVTHAPPYSILDKTFLGKHVGSKVYYEFLQKKKPMLWITGHIHECRGVEKLHNTIVVNPGPLMKRYYAVINVEDSNVKVFLKKL